MVWWELVDSDIIFHLSKLWSHVLHAGWCNISLEAAGEIWTWSLLMFDLPLSEIPLCVAEGIPGYLHCSYDMYFCQSKACEGVFYKALRDDPKLDCRYFTHLFLCLLRASSVDVSCDHVGTCDLCRACHVIVSRRVVRVMWSCRDMSCVSCGCVEACRACHVIVSGRVVLALSAALKIVCQSFIFFWRERRYLRREMGTTEFCHRTHSIYPSFSTVKTFRSCCDATRGFSRKTATGITVREWAANWTSSCTTHWKKTCTATPAR